MTMNLNDFVIASDRHTDIEMYEGYDAKTVIIEWDGEQKRVYGFDEADCVYTGDSIDACADAIGLGDEEMCGLVGSDVTYLIRR